MKVNRFHIHVYIMERFSCICLHETAERALHVAREIHFILSQVDRTAYGCCKEIQ